MASRSGRSLPVTVLTSDARWGVLDLEQPRYRDRSRDTALAEVVAQQVDDHEVLCAILRTGGELARQRGVARGSAARGRVPLIGRVSTRSPLSSRKRSGEALSTPAEWQVQ